MHETLFGMFVMTKYVVNEQQIEDVDHMHENDLNALRYAAVYAPWKRL